MYYLPENKEYIRTLTVLLQDADMQQDIQKSSFKANSLIDIAREYHEKVCQDEQCIIYEWEKKPITIHKVIYAGFLFSKINLGGASHSSFSPGGLIGFRFSFENVIDWAENLSFDLDLKALSLTNFTLYADKSYYTFITYNNVEYNLTITEEYYRKIVCKSMDINIKTIALGIPVMASYTFSKGRLRPYAAIGLINTFVLSQNKNLFIHRFYDEFNKSIPWYHFGVAARAGTSFLLRNHHLINLELNWEYTQNMNINQMLKMYNNLFSMNAGYSF